MVLQRQPHPNPPQSWGGKFGSNAHSLGSRAHSLGSRAHSLGSRAHSLGSRAHSLGSRAHSLETENKPDNERVYEEKRALIRISFSPKIDDVAKNWKISSPSPSGKGNFRHRRQTSCRPVKIGGDSEGVENPNSSTPLFFCRTINDKDTP